MNRSRFMIATAIIACIILASFLISVPHARELALAPAVQTAAPSVPNVALHDAFQKGMHVITGAVDVPDACTNVSAQATLAGATSSAASILVAISVPEDSGLCLQLPSRQSFSTTLAAPAHMPIVVTVNGIIATTSAL